MSGRKLEESEVRELIATGEIGPLDGFVSAKTGNRFPSKIKIVDDEKKPGQKKAELDFGAKVDVNALEPFWTDPKTKAELCEGPTSYILREKIDGEWTESFKVGRLMCQKPLTREMAIDLVGPNKKTGLIQGFTSKKGRPFDAFLLRVGPKIAWEFPPRAPRAAGKNADGTDGGTERQEWLRPQRGSDAFIHQHLQNTAWAEHFLRHWQRCDIFRLAALGLQFFQQPRRRMRHCHLLRHIPIQDDLWRRIPTALFRQPIDFARTCAMRLECRPAPFWCVAAARLSRLARIA
jgi:hypothetical protein